MMMFAFLIFSSLLSVLSAKRYQAHDKVLAVANTVGPFNNPTETYPVRHKIYIIIFHLFPFSIFTSFLPFLLLLHYQFYSLPFCSGTGKQKRHKQDLGETLSGSRKVTTPYEISFLDPVPWRSLCEDYLDATDVRIHISCLIINFICYYYLI